MNEEFVVLRILHIVSGVFWTGSAIFLATILEPRLRALGPAVQGPVMRALMPAMLFCNHRDHSGRRTTLALRLRWGYLDRFLSTDWGWAMLIGFVASMLAFARRELDFNSCPRVSGTSAGQTPCSWSSP